MSIEIYTKPTCGYCIRAKEFLNQKGIKFKEYTIGQDASKEDIQKRVHDLGLATEIKTVPQIFYTNKNGQTIHIGGYTDLVAKEHLLKT